MGPLRAVEERPEPHRHRTGKTGKHQPPVRWKIKDWHVHVRTSRRSARGTNRTRRRSLVHSLKADREQQHVSIPLTPTVPLGRPARLLGTRTGRRATDDERSEIFVFWSFLKSVFTNNLLAKHFLKIDHHLRVLEHRAEVSSSALCQLTPWWCHVSEEGGRSMRRGNWTHIARRRAT